MFNQLPKNYCLFCRRKLIAYHDYLACPGAHYEVNFDYIVIATQKYIIDVLKSGTINGYLRNPIRKLPENFTTNIMQIVDLLKLSSPQELNDKIDKLINFI